MARRSPICRTLIMLAFLFGLGVAISHAEIAPMTRDRSREAEQVGRRAVNGGEIVHTATCWMNVKHGTHMFDVTITTPFASFAYAVFDAKKKKEAVDLAHWTIAPPEQQVVIVSVDPASISPGGVLSAPPISVARILLRRGDVVIEARRSDTHEVLFPHADEKHRKFRGRVAYFPLEPFASRHGDLEIVVIPETDEPGAEAVLKLRKTELARLR